MSPEEDRLPALLRRATQLKQQKDWHGAVAALSEAKSLMLVSPVVYAAATWCRYPLLLQQAGRFDEAMREFRFLLDDLERRARRDARLDEPSVGRRAQKLSFYKIIIRDDRKEIESKMALATARESKRRES